MNAISSTVLSLVISQMNNVVGDINGNVEKIMSAAISARDDLKADLVIFPESSILGFSSQDLVNEESYQTKISEAIDKLKQIKGIPMVIEITSNDYDQVLVINNGTIEYEYLSEDLEDINNQNHFHTSKPIDLYKIKNTSIGFSVGNNIKNTDILSKYSSCGINLLVSLNSPIFHLKNYETLIDDAKNASNLTNSPVICSCSVGAQDQIICTGGSFAIDKNQQMVAQASYLKDQLVLIEFIEDSKNIVGEIQSNPKYDSIEMLYSCLVTSLRDYVHKNGFSKVVLGVSGGIDSALAATIAVDALGKDNVIAVMMPYKYTSSTSIELAEKLADNLGIELNTIAIHEIYNVVADKIISAYNFKIKSTTDSGNLQARSRALLLMTIANINNAIVLNTGNKSEVATGYCTIYGDSIGGFAVLADVFKSVVYILSTYRNQVSKVIPKKIIQRQPTAELYHQQLDRDQLPEYKVLDEIIKMYLEGESIDNIADETYQDETTVQKVLNMINNAEYKRQQAPIAPLIELLGFDKNIRNYPITNKWRY